MISATVFPQYKSTGDCSVSEGGLTKREHIAIEMTKAIITGQLSAPGDAVDLSQCLDMGITVADRLVERLGGAE